jgi:UDP-N-acetylmuramate--alanine ligase
MIVEADESDGTFIRLPTEVGVVTNIDPEHLDHFKTVENMHREYEIFLKNIPFYGLAVACTDHPVVRGMIERLALRADGRRLLTYGTDEGTDLRLLGIGYDGSGAMQFDAEISARVRGGARRIKGWSIPLLGQHNALNALAAIAIATHACVPDEAIRTALASFSGVKRRFQVSGTWNGLTIYDDYGHHPVEIAAVLAAARAAARGRIIAIVEPHRYTRVRDLFGEFSSCFKDADSVIVAPLYSAGEQPIDGIDQHTLAQGIASTGKPVIAVDSPHDLVPLLRRHGRSGDSVIFMGAGNSTEWAHQLSGWLEVEAAQ